MPRLWRVRRKRKRPVKRSGPPSPRVQTRRQSKSSTLDIDFLKKKLCLIFKISKPERTDITSLIHQHWMSFLLISFLPCQKCIFTPLYPFHLVSQFLFSSLLLCNDLHLFPHSQRLPVWCQHLTFHLCGCCASLFLSSSLICLLPPPLSSLCMMVMDGPYGWVGCERGCDEDWPWRGESESERCVWECVCVGVCVLGGNIKEREKVGYAERRTERLRNAVKGGADKESKTGKKIRRWAVEKEWMKMMAGVGLRALLLMLGGALTLPCALGCASDQVLGRWWAEMDSGQLRILQSMNCIDLKREIIPVRGIYYCCKCSVASWVPKTRGTATTRTGRQQLTASLEDLIACRHVL